MNFKKILLTYEYKYRSRLNGQDKQITQLTWTYKRVKEYNFH
jgi:hypothetical protein